MGTVKDQPKGLGGWLIVVAIGLFVSPIRMLYFIINDTLPIFNEGYWEVLTTPGSEAYHFLWSPLIIMELVGNSVFLLFALILIILFFAKSHWFPILMVVYLATNLVFVTSDFVFSLFIPAIAAMDNTDTIREVFRSLAGAAIWIPYMLISKRVKNTFIKPEHNQQVELAN